MAGSLPLANLTKVPLACATATEKELAFCVSLAVPVGVVSELRPLCPRATVKSFVETPETNNSSFSINIISPTAIPVPLATVKVVSELEYSAPSFIVVANAPSVVPPHCPAPQPLPPTVVSVPVFI